ncbi:MAG TPA: SDR family oxidoreductase [Mycobacteriales bacterium]|jgi:NAD(P)-dependent dehydrogenase (short-subunit alcohol dehydrogenase family)|nr:SDR family oxidoreductase [Mycobacteriales bacterium]
MPTPQRIAVVTGAGQGIGRRVSERLAEAGYGVVLVDVREPAETARAIGAAAVPAVVDVSDESAVVELTRRTVREFGRIDVLVNNAGISAITPAEDTTAEQWRRVLEVNLTGPFLLSREIGRIMLAAGSGSIVNVASIAGLRGVSDRAAYNASKHGLVGLTRTLAGEWGGRGVRVNAVCPGWVKTEMDAADQAGGGYADEDIIGQVPMARFARPDDIAAAVEFLADSTVSGFINGAALPVDGGWSTDASWQSLRLRKR